MFLLLLVIEVERPVRRGNGLWENRHRQNCQGAAGSCLESGLRSPGWSGKGGRNPSLSQRQSLASQQQPWAWKCAIQTCMQLEQVCRTVELWLSSVTPDYSLETLYSCATLGEIT